MASFFMRAYSHRRNSYNGKESDVKGDSGVMLGGRRMNESISRWIRQHGALSPQRVALTAEDRTMTYAQLDERADRVASVLRGSLGLDQGDRLAVLTLNCPEWFEILTAAARIGVVMVPLNVRLSPIELQYQVQDAGCKALICGEEFTPRLPEWLPGTPVVHLLGLGPAYEELVAAAPAGPVPDVAANTDPLLIIYTSGTTGKPKGAVLTHGAMLYNALNNCVGIGLTAEDVTLTVLPLFHVGGIGLFSLPALYAGARVVLPRRFDAAEALRLIERERVTVTMTVPTIMQAYIEALDRLDPRPDLSSCRGFISGGAPCPAELIAAAAERGLPYGQGYGMTETAPTVFLQPEMQRMRELPAGGQIGRPGTIGKPVLFAEVLLLDEGGAPVPPGTVGEICVRGGNVFAGYWNQPEATAAAFTPDGYFRSGDLARADEDGYVTIMGRKKEMLISGGENVYPLEVEQALSAHPAVAEVAVVGIPDARWGEVPGAAVVLKAGAEVTPDDLTAWCRTRLAGYKIPKRWLILPALPRTAIGKVIKPDLITLIQEAT